MGRIKGRHRRPSKTSKAISAASTTVAAGGLAAAAITTSSTGSQPVIHASLTAVVNHTTSDAPANGPATITVAAGDSLSKIAQGNCATTADWTGLYLSNKTQIGSDPNVITPGEQLTLDCYQGTVTPVETPYEHWHHVNHLNHLANLVQPAAAPEQAAPQNRPVQEASEQHTQSTVATSGDGSFQACVIKRESGGNPDVMNSTGHYGLYQFSASTWAEYGGNPSDFGHASVSEQNQVFGTAMASPGGESNWSPYDGC